MTQMTWWCECMERNISVCFPTFCSTRLIAYITFLMQTTKHIDLKSGTSYQALGGIFVIHVFLDKHRKIASPPPLTFFSSFLPVFYFYIGILCPSTESVGVFFFCRCCFLATKATRLEKSSHLYQK